MKNCKLLLALGISLFMFGCASGAKMENMVFVDQIGDYKTYDDGLKKEIAVDNVSGGEKTNPAWTSEIGNEEFKGALKNSLAEQGLLSNIGRYKLQVMLLDVKQPLFGFDMEVTTNVKYILVDSKDNKIILDKTIQATYTATVGDAFAGVKRLRLANEGSGRKNIEGLLEELSKLKIKKHEVGVVN